MGTGVIVQARMSSKRLPGKVLMPLAGKPLLAWLIERLQQTSLPIVVATSRLAEDDAVEKTARELRVACYRGPLDDVAARLAQAAVASGFDSLVRANADSPLLDPALIRQAVALFADGGADLVTNVFPRSFPKGMSVETVSLPALERAIDESDKAADREHVTRHMYANPGKYRIRNFSAANPRPELQLSVDTAADFGRIEAIIAGLGAKAPSAGWEEIAARAEALA